MESQHSRHPVEDPARSSGESSHAHPGAPLDARACIEPGTAARLAVSCSIALLFIGFLVFTISGLLLALIWMVGEYLVARRARALLRGSALRVSAQQFPQVHACASAHAQRLSLEDLPEIYVVDAAEVNGFAMRLGARNAIVLTDEIVHAGLAAGAWDALSFVIAHELGHISLGHHRWWRSMLRRYRPLSRWDEFSADNIACELVGTREAAECGVLMLISGPKLLALTNRQAAFEQASEVVADPLSKRAERTLTHPLGLRRLDRVAQRSWPAQLRRVA